MLELETLDRPNLLKTTRKLLAQMQALSSRISAVGEIATEINKTLDLEKILEVFGKQTKWLLDFQHCSICLVKRDGSHQFVTFFGAGKGQFDLEELMAAEAPIGRALQSRRPQLLRDAAQENIPTFRSLMILPLAGEGDLFGTINFAAVEANTYSQEDMRIAYLLALQLTSALRNARHFEEIRHLYSQLEVEKKTADQLLLNILPEAIAHELKEKGQVSPVYYPSATVMFSDFAGFTQLAAQMPPNELLQELDFCFSGFDQIIARHGLEKLKTIGDSYMCVGGVPVPSETHAVEMVTAALEMMAMMKEREADKAQQNQPYWQTRMGIHTGPLIAGVIGRQKFSYDIWGNTVNLASRVEAASLPNAITISKSTYELVKDVFCCESRGEISIKGADKMEMYLVIGFR